MNRWSIAYLNRFVSPDTIVPNPANPQSLNRYSYVYNNPLLYTDPSGHDPLITAIAFFIRSWFGEPNIAPWDPPVHFKHRVDEPITSRDMTQWTVNQMVQNSRSDYVQSIQAHLELGSEDANYEVAAMQAWTTMVGPGNTWDFKVDIERQPWFAEGERNVILGGVELNYDVVANMHFGFVGRAAGFKGDFLVISAGLAQEMLYRRTGNPNDKGVLDLEYWGDHPFATWSIRLGIFLYDTYGPEGLNEEAFAEGLELYIDEYGEPPDPPPGAVAP